MRVARQHLIDPEICICCNTCEATCPVGAVMHNERNYVVKFDACMEQGVEEAFADVCRQHGIEWSVTSQDLVGQGRFHVDTY